MYTEEKEFVVRFSLTASFPDAYDGDADEYVWAREWESHVKPDVVKAVFRTLRAYPGWKAHVRNRGRSPDDEIEIVVERTDLTPPVP